MEGLGTRPVLPVRVTIGGKEAMVDYAGPSPGSVAALLQVNALVPYDVEPGEAIPVELILGDEPSGQGPTISIE